jgi:hypothetical protein
MGDCEEESKATRARCMSGSGPDRRQGRPESIGGIGGQRGTPLQDGWQQSSAAAAVLECGEGRPAAGVKLRSEVFRSNVSHDCSAVCAQ